MTTREVPKEIMAPKEKTKSRSVKREQAKETPSDEEAKETLVSFHCSWRWVLCGLVLCGVIIGITVGLLAKPGPPSPEILPIIESKDQESIPALVKVAPIPETGDGALLVEYTEPLPLFKSDDHTYDTETFYYLNVQDLDFSQDFGVYNPNTLVLYLTQTASPTIDDIQKFESERRQRLLRGKELATHMYGDETIICVGRPNKMEFPIRLPESFFPGDFNGAIVVERSPYDDSFGVGKQVVSSSFFVINAEENVGSGNSVVVNPKIAMPPPAPVLVSELVGDFEIGGSTITIDAVMGFEKGVVVNKPRVTFDIPSLVDIPGLYLYLSPLPFSKAVEIDESRDVLVLIDQGTDGQFNVQGRFEQFLDEVTLIDLEQYFRGSWVVWYEPATVWIAGGPIVVKKDDNDEEEGVADAATEPLTPMLPTEDPPIEDPPIEDPPIEDPQSDFETIATTAPTTADTPEGTGAPIEITAAPVAVPTDAPIRPTRSPVSSGGDDD